MKKQFLMGAVLSILLNCTTTTDPSLPHFITVEGGTFTMGDEHGLGEDDEQPTHEVTLSGFKISKTEVTVAQYRKYCNATDIDMPEEPIWGWNDNHPIVNVFWSDARDYCNWLSEELDQNISLPTEAQWEFAARGGNNSQGYKYSGGNSITETAWYKGNGNSQTHAVAGKKPNELGLYDMTGNVWEWCLDWYDENYYTNSPKKNPENMKRKTFRTIRGGCWLSEANYCTVSTRGYDRITFKCENYGFRIVSLDLPFSETK